MINTKLLTALTLSAGVASATSTGSVDVNLSAGLTTLLGATAQTSEGQTGDSQSSGSLLGAVSSSISAGVSASGSTTTEDGSASGSLNLGADAGLTALLGATPSSMDGQDSASLLTGLSGALNVIAAASGTAQP
ncbi:hypothetical protein [Deinococcus sp. RM]|uniref:hypothetical protein n=1 Tax=Deinococcus sp. RM TaxID=2316359 RepID=UPI000E69C544|nr:hypothetical protein [Deinococcus sp. RM]RIY15107.1 hypothetical protein D3W47_04260 [Deinococcus sp. RM]